MLDEVSLGAFPAAGGACAGVAGVVEPRACPAALAAAAWRHAGDRLGGAIAVVLGEGALGDVLEAAWALDLLEVGLVEKE